MTTVGPTERLLEEREERAKDEIERKTGKTTEQLYEEREKRYRDAIELREPDRIPVCFETHWFTGVDNILEYQDAGAFREANKKIILDYDPDIYAYTLGQTSGTALGILDPMGYRWPGGGLPPDAMPQVIETEPMKADEYDHFIFDPGDWTLRRYLPRLWKAMAPFAKLPPLQSLWGPSTLATQSARFSSPEIVKAFETLFQAGEEQEKFLKTETDARSFEDEMAALGFPPRNHPGGIGTVPFDTLADNLRQLRGIMADIYRRPDKLLAACEKLWEWRLSQGLVPADPKKRGNPKVVNAGGTHHGGDGWMSKKHYETFYWPFWKKAMLKNIELGFINYYWGQGYCDTRLEYFLEIPKGKLVVHVCETSAQKAKEILGGHHCVMGGVPHVLLQIASPQEVEEFCKKLIKTCGKGGGFVVGTSARLTQEAKPQNVRAMIETVKKYGAY